MSFSSLLCWTRISMRSSRSWRNTRNYGKINSSSSLYVLVIGKNMKKWVQMVLIKSWLFSQTTSLRIKPACTSTSRNLLRSKIYSENWFILFWITRKNTNNRLGTTTRINRGEIKIWFCIWGPGQEF